MADDRSKFAGSVVLGDLSDFVAPAISCINPKFSSSDSQPSQSSGGAKLNIDSSIFSGFEEKAEAPDLIRAGDTKAAKVSLHDCLACSGCVTSAETVLISQQSVDEFLRVLRANEHKLVVVSFAPQPLASLAEKYNVSVSSAYRKLASLFLGLGVDGVCDTAVASRLSLREMYREFEGRLSSPSKKMAWTRPEYSVAKSWKSSENPLQSESSGVGDVDMRSAAAEGKEDPVQPLPLLASACPGWICLAEKSHPEALRYVSHTKSPQQITGSLLKYVVVPMAFPDSKEEEEEEKESKSQRESLPSSIAPADVYHVTVMPCFDKKLEASRLDFYDELRNAHDVDCVLTAGELPDLFDAAGCTFEELEEITVPGPGGKDDSSVHKSVNDSGVKRLRTSSLSSAQAVTLETALRPLRSMDAEGRRFFRPVKFNAGSGGFCDYILRRAAREKLSVRLTDKLGLEQKRNAGFQEITVRSEDGERSLTFALAYGFRNIQTIISSLRRRKQRWDFVEVMACPSGCVNGGGQLASKAFSKEDEAGTKTRTVRVESLLHETDVSEPDSDSDAHREDGEGQSRTAVQAFEATLEDFPVLHRRVLHTSYHAVPPMEKLNPMGIKW